MFDINKYLGTWFSLMSYPMPFQKDCTSITAQYTKIADGIEVHNTCFDKNNKFKEIYGMAYPTNDPMILQVRFFWPFKSEYKIEYIDENYQYVIVGNSKKSVLWIMARTKNVPVDDFNRLIDVAISLGYDIDRLEWTV